VRQGGLCGGLEVPIRVAGRKARQSAHRRERDKRMEEAFLDLIPSFFFLQVLFSALCLHLVFSPSLFLLVSSSSSRHRFLHRVFRAPRRGHPRRRHPRRGGACEYLKLSFAPDVMLLCSLFDSLLALLLLRPLSSRFPLLSRPTFDIFSPCCDHITLASLPSAEKETGKRGFEVENRSLAFGQHRM